MKYGSLSWGQTEALVNKVGGMDGVNGVLSGELVVVDREQALAGLMKLVGEPLEVPAHTRFIVRDKFIGTTNGDVPIVLQTAGFTLNFHDIIEMDVEATTLKQRKLRYQSFHGPILSAFGVAENAVISLAHIYDFLKMADRTHRFVFYANDKEGNPRSVMAWWVRGERGWSISSRAISSPDVLHDSNHVVTR